VEDPIRVGIEVSAAKLDVAIDFGRDPVWTGSFENDAAGHRGLLRALARKHRNVRVCLEATGVYHLDLSSDKQLHVEGSDAWLVLGGDDRGHVESAAQVAVAEERSMACCTTIGTSRESNSSQWRPDAEESICGWPLSCGRR
jgi:hypothetical protein